MSEKAEHHTTTSISVADLSAKLAAVEEQLAEAEAIICERDDRMALVDRIADLIGLPHDQELDQVAFELWFERNKSPLTNVTSPDLTNEQREITLLRIIEAMGGLTDSSESPHSWLNWFCSDEIHNVQDDTFNRCHEKGWLWTTHNSDWDTSTTTLTVAGRAAIATSDVLS